MAKCNNNITVESLPIKQSTSTDDYLLLYNNSTTSRIKFSDVVIGAENVDFYPELIQIINSVDSITTNVSTNSSDWESTYNTVAANSANWNDLTTSLGADIIDVLKNNTDDLVEGNTILQNNSGSWTYCEHCSVN